MGQSWGDFLPMAFMCCWSNQKVIPLVPIVIPNGNSNWLSDFLWPVSQCQVSWSKPPGDWAGCLRSAHFRAALVLTLEQVKSLSKHVFWQLQFNVVNHGKPNISTYHLGMLFVLPKLRMMYISCMLPLVPVSPTTLVTANRPLQIEAFHQLPFAAGAVALASLGKPWETLR